MHTENDSYNLYMAMYNPTFKLSQDNRQTDKK